MKIKISSKPEQDPIYTTLTCLEDVDHHGGEVTVGCWVPFDDSREVCAESTKKEAVRLLKLALSALDA